jgi:hypothetical protein
MARIITKYKCGQEVSCHGVKGLVTAVIIRGKNRSYEFSYRNSDGNPTSVSAEECELSSDLINSIGFKRQ